MLQHIVRDLVHDDLTIVQSIDQALHALQANRPDLMLLPTLISPGEEAELLAAVRELPNGGRVEMLITPVLGEPDQGRAATPRGWRRWTARRSSKAADGDEVRAFADRLTWSLECARERQNAEDLTPAPEPVTESAAAATVAEAAGCEPPVPVLEISAQPPEIVFTRVAPEPVVTVQADATALATDAAAPPESERRAHRRYGAHELHGLCAARIQSGPAVSIIDVSSGGVLIEADEPLRASSEAVLELSGLGVDATVPLRVVRCQVSALRGAPCYRAACEFIEPVDVEGFLTADLSAAVEAAPRDLVDDGVSAQPAGAERRRHVRVTGPFDGRRLGLIDTPIVISDLSEGGCFLDSLVDAETGCRLRLGVAVPGGEWITVSAEVVHGRPGFGFAVRFVDVSEVARVALAGLVAAYAGSDATSGVGVGEPAFR